MGELESLNETLLLQLKVVKPLAPAEICVCHWVTVGNG